jgi:predicted lipid-binding transport protein (Tim44 family)
MRKLITWIVVTIGIAALVRKLRSRGTADEAVSSPSAADPADELRQKLASTREPEPAAADAEAPAEVPAKAGAAETADEFRPVEPPTPEPASEAAIDERRAEVHDEGRAAIDEMRKATED